MPKTRETDELMRVHVMVARGDWLTWSALFEKNIGQSQALRIIMRDYLKRVERKMEERERAAEEEAAKEAAD